MPLRVTHLPVNMAGIAYKNVEALKRRGVDARLVVFKPQPFRPTEFDVNLDRPDGFLRAQLTQWRALAQLLPKTDVFHFYFGLTLVPRRLQFPILRATAARRSSTSSARTSAARRPSSSRTRSRPTRASSGRTTRSAGARCRRDPIAGHRPHAHTPSPDAATRGRRSSTRRRARRAREPSSSKPRARSCRSTSTSSTA